MNINERLVINKPKSVVEGSARAETVWTRRSILRAIWEMRRKIMTEKGVDIFQVYEMTDCIEVHIEGDFATIPAAPEWIQKVKRAERRKAR